MILVWSDIMSLITGAEARSKLLLGVNKVANAVKGTFGPNARTVIIQNPIGMPVILNDGVSIARAVHDTDPYAQMGIDLLKEVASEAQEKSGDGTTGATLIAQTLCNGSLSLMESGTSPLKIRDEFKLYLSETEEFIQSESITDFDLVNVATIASNNDRELGNLIAGVVEKVGRHGAITIEKSPTTETYVRESKGLEVNAGFAHAVMANASRNKCEYKNPMIITTTEKLESFQSLVPSLEIAVKENKPLVIFAPDYNPMMLQNLLVNIVQGKVSVCIVKPSGMPQQQQAWLEDISSATNSHLFKVSLGETIKEITSKQMGTCETFDSSPTTTTLSVKENDNTNHINYLTEQRDSETNDWLREEYNNRLQRITSGVSTIYVGGSTDVEQTESKERVDDAVNACKLALESGVVIGGGATLYHASQALRKAGHSGEVFELFVNGLLTPITTIVSNSGATKTRYSLGKAYYMCGKTGEMRKAKEDGVYDPTQVVLNSLESAVSIAALLLMTDAAIIAPTA